MLTPTDQLRDLDVPLQSLRELPDRNAIRWYCDARSGRIERDLWIRGYAPAVVGIQMSFHRSTTIATVKRDGHMLPPGRQRRVFAPHFDWHLLTAARCGEELSIHDDAVHEVFARELSALLRPAQDSELDQPIVRYQDSAGVNPSSAYRVSTGVLFGGSYNGPELTAIYRTALDRLAELALQVATKK